MSFDDRFARILREAADLAPGPPGPALVGGAERRGRRRRARRHAALTAGACALALVGLTVTGAADLGSRDPAGRPGDRITGTFMSGTLRSLLPPGQVTDVQGFGIGELTAPSRGPIASLVFDDGRGRGIVRLITDRVDPPGTGDTADTRCPDPFQTPTESCERTVRPDGSVLVVAKYPSRDPDDQRNWVVTYTGADGRRIRVDEYNGAYDTVTREEPPLTADQLAAVATSPAWDPVFEQFTRDATPRPTAPGTTVTPPSPDLLLGVLRTLLPAGAEPHPAGEQQTRGTAHLLVTADGRTSMLSVRVDPRWAQGLDHDPRGSYGSGSEDPVVRAEDGTLSFTREDHASKGGEGPALSWGAEALHPDGTRVTVGEWNGTTGYQAEPGEPALTKERLRAIAADPAWRR
ncbi:hypothetical protein [Kitasatospora camelliae]|uniref:Uncharacterized protein n=1 Tax=Kitasatospora camelliae TaxID=3156397 RepID=A0AAU8K297_9ACTN